MCLQVRLIPGTLKRKKDHLTIFISEFLYCDFFTGLMFYVLLVKIKKKGTSLLSEICKLPVVLLLF